jgi:23S rRNA (pseudouridine1915-N3)-methyltransferase
MKISVIAVGRLKDKSVAALARSYEDRLPAGLKLAWVEVAGEQGNDPARARAQEAENLRARIPERATVVALSEHGRELSSREFARFIASVRDSGRDLAFLIGGADGLDPSLLKQADQTLALSKLTFPHELVRALLAEQLYRAFSILRGDPYHRD